MSRKGNPECDYKGYTDAYETAIEEITAFVEKHEKNNNLDFKNQKKLRSEYKSKDLDPDSEFYRIHGKGDVECYADGLISITRLCCMVKNADKIAKEYAEYRRTPIFYFPSVDGGINGSRANPKPNPRNKKKPGFGDRIDHTLFDIKNYCEGMTIIKNDNSTEADKNTARKLVNACTLKPAYEIKETTLWFESFNYDFKAIIDWYGVYGIFVNEDYEVYDLEHNDGRIIEDYAESYAWKWSDEYYNNLKAKIKEFENKSPKMEVKMI